MIESLKHPARLMKKAYRSPVFWLAVATFCLLYAVWQADKDRPLVVRKAQVVFCKTVSQPGAIASADRDSDIAEIDRDLNVFASAAARARRVDGNPGTAAIYEAVVKRSKTRVVKAKRREMQARRRAAIPCEERFPTP